MNIKRAKEEIEHTVKAYLAKDALGEYAIPAIRQRPILLMGPPGIGKTQVMEQVARECGVALVAYTITHHTRQSAVGLPFIRQRHYGGKDVSVTEYTMSEIIASVYAKMEATGLTEGILFIDEINCVSETLAPTMLQFLQCKTFGNQAVPAGWVIVAAGNPPEYNKSVRDFDIVTLDRVRRMDIRARPLGLERLRPRGPHPQRHPELSGAAPAELLPDQRRCGRHPVCHRPRLGGPLQPAGHLRDAGPDRPTKTSSASTSSTRRSPRTSRPTSTSTTSTATITAWRTFWPGRSSLLLYARLLNAPFDERLSLVSLILAGLDTRFTASRPAGRRGRCLLCVPAAGQAGLCRRCPQSWHMCRTARRSLFQPDGGRLRRRDPEAAGRRPAEPGPRWNTRLRAAMTVLRAWEAELLPCQGRAARRRRV